MLAVTYLLRAGFDTEIALLGFEFNTFTVSVLKTIKKRFQIRKPIIEA